MGTSCLRCRVSICAVVSLIGRVPGFDAFGVVQVQPAIVSPSADAPGIP